MFWAESAGRVLTLGDAAPVAEVVMHWAEAGREITVYVGESRPGRAVDQLVRDQDGTIRRTERGLELVEDGNPGWLDAIGVVDAVR